MKETIILLYFLQTDYGRRLLRFLKEKEIAFGNVHSELPTLNDVFLEITVFSKILDDYENHKDVMTFPFSSTQRHLSASPS